MCRGVPALPTVAYRISSECTTTIADEKRMLASVCKIPYNMLGLHMYGDIKRVGLVAPRLVGATAAAAKTRLYNSMSDHINMLYTHLTAQFDDFPAVGCSTFTPSGWTFPAIVHQ
eukprot:7641891-Karenia_brevis.AAC.1